MLLYGLSTSEGRQRRLEACHVIVCGNEKGGSGKSTLAMHVSVALAKLGFAVATIDTDTRQRTLTRYAAYRQRWCALTGEQLPLADHFTPDGEVPKGVSGADNGDGTGLDAGFNGNGSATANGAEFDKLPCNGDGAGRLHRYEALRERYDFVVFDTPGSFTPISSFAHGQADTLITPINDSFIDFDVLANIDPETFEIQELAQYAGAVRDARRMRRTNSGEIIDWVVVRNRMSPISSRNERRVYACMRELSMKLGFRLANGIGERVIFREWFQRGLTALDQMRDEDGEVQRLSVSHLAARNEVRRLVEALRLPIDDRGRRRAQARREWLSTARPAIRIPDIFAS